MGILSKFFSGGQSEKRDTTYQGPRPHSSVTSGVLGKQLRDTLSARMAGQGVGIPGGNVGQTYGSNIANRIMKRGRDEIDNFRSQRAADVGRGAGALSSPVVANQLLNLKLEAGASKDQIDLDNELLKRREIADAIGRGQQFNASDVNALTNYSNFEKGLHNDQITQENARRKAEADANGQIFDAILAASTGGMTGGMSGGGGGDLFSNLLSRSSTANAQPQNTALSNYYNPIQYQNPTAQDYYKKYILRGQ